MPWLEALLPEGELELLLGLLLELPEVLGLEEGLPLGIDGGMVDGGEALGLDGGGGGRVADWPMQPARLTAATSASAAIARRTTAGETGWVETVSIFSPVVMGLPCARGNPARGCT
ncbi:MAG: hypothetical protein P8080_00135 [Gammaproteobacteria bacterium]